jgi:hypothetical protein
MGVKIPAKSGQCSVSGGVTTGSQKYYRRPYKRMK